VEIDQQQRAWRRSTSIASVEEIHARQRVCGGDRGETRIRWRSNSSDANLHSGSSSGDPGGGGDERKGVRTRRAAACVLTCPCACADPNRTSGCRRRSLLLCAEIDRYLALQLSLLYSARCLYVAFLSCQCEGEGSFPVGAGSTGLQATPRVAARHSWHG
jgi:hypothetical protein